MLCNACARAVSCMLYTFMHVCVCMYVFVCVGEKERERVCVCVPAAVKDRCTTACLFATVDLKWHDFFI